MNSVIKKNLLIEGKTKKIYCTNNPFEIIIHYKDNLTSLNGKKNEIYQDKGILNNEINTHIFQFLNSCGINTHFIKRINNREQLCMKLKMIPLEFVLRNIVSGSMAQRLGIEEGIKINKNGIIEIFYKNDQLQDPLINDHHAIFLDIISYEELNYIYSIMKKINNILKQYFLSKNIILVDFKLEFGKNTNNEISLADEISPETCRFWDKITMKKLDKDPFRKNLTTKHIDIIDVYMEILKRLHHNSSYQ
ncbi:phosphoribosylaminoimidazolesuccinocarboxamide synthase [Blattabacterium cuenoti]|uniref:phosphoribosylaminoimidazolesuccinocarboxamide synthase n=1 Tax=Blattabacterium cuenoti TaxID=1653831 RepID=UPI00163BB700|nr:phosphoribosylaminoimidazolesuccinocarboxamide synthase [Blattabacterium cuenoti]